MANPLKTPRKLAIIAGAGLGLGRSLALRFAAAGYDLALLARTRARLSRIRQDVLASCECEVSLHPADLTQPPQVNRAFRDIFRSQKRAHVLVCSASYLPPSMAGITELQVSSMKRELVNAVMIPVLCARRVIPVMLCNGGGTIIFTGASGSMIGECPRFSAAKFALRGLAQAMARDLGSKGIHVAHVILDGKLSASLSQHIAKDALRSSDVADMYVRLAEQGPHAWTFEMDLRAAGGGFF